MFYMMLSQNRHRPQQHQRFKLALTKVQHIGDITDTLQQQNVFLQPS